MKNGILRALLISILFTNFVLAQVVPSGYNLIQDGKSLSKINSSNPLSNSILDVIAIGDSATDIPLFKIAKTSIALGNSFDDVKSQATMTVSAKAGDGVIEALDKLAPQISGV